VPAVVSREMEETWIAERQIQCEANREHIIIMENLEFARFVEMMASIVAQLLYYQLGHLRNQCTGNDP
jgi:hypothetical protein